MERFTIQNLLTLKEKLSTECNEHFQHLMEQRDTTQRQIDDLEERTLISEEIAKYAMLGLNAETNKKYTAFERKRALELGRKCLKELVS